jgi:RHS repeat-associated protein
MRLIEERRRSSVISYVYEPDSYVPLARLDADGNSVEQGGLGTKDDAVFQSHDVVTPNSGVVAPNGGTGPVNNKSAKTPDKVISDAEARYWASLYAESARRAQELGISQNNGADNSDPKLCNVYYFHTDQVGLPEELSNSKGQLVWKASYKTWGSTVAESWDITDLKGDRVFESERGDIPTGEQRQQNLRFQGQYLDRETGLHYNTFRYYDPDIGRFISPDPIGLDGGINLSAYSPNPISWIDPLGWHCSDRDIIKRGDKEKILSVKGIIYLKDLRTGTPTDAASRARAKRLGKRSDDAGHTRGRLLGGSGAKEYIFPQNPKINRGPFREFEKKIHDHIKKERRSVTFEQKFIYGNGGTRPTKIIYKVYDKGKLIFNEPFDN